MPIDSNGQGYRSVAPGDPKALTNVMCLRLQSYVLLLSWVEGGLRAL